MATIRNSATVVLGLAMAMMLAMATLPAVGVAAKPAAGPKVQKCGKFKKTPMQRCQRQNQANRVAFNQIKNSSFVGQRGDGQYVDHYFCADGRYETRTLSSTGTGIGKGTRWWISGAVVRQGGKWINAFLSAPGGFEIGILRRGPQWQVAVASLGRMLYPGNVAKVSASKSCA